MRILYRKSGRNNQEFQEDYESTIEDACSAECPSSPRQGVRVSTKADDSAEEDVDMEEEESKMDSESSNNDLSKDNSGEGFQHLRRGLIDRALVLHAEELCELASDEELKNFVEDRGKRYLQSATDR
jgi:hypothetical protein